MPNKCIVKDCKSNYASQKAKGLPQVPVYRFPSTKNEGEMRKKWIDAVVNNDKELVVTEYSVVCAKHWPFGFKKYSKISREIQAEPPSLFGYF